MEQASIAKKQIFDFYFFQSSQIRNFAASLKKRQEFHEEN